jgi:hypothetical protein
MEGEDFAVVSIEELLGPDFKTATALSTSDVALMLNWTKSQVEKKKKESDGEKDDSAEAILTKVFEKSSDFCNKFHHFKDQAIAEACRQFLMDHEYHSYEIAWVMNMTLPGTDEAVEGVYFNFWESSLLVVGDVGRTWCVCALVLYFSS